MNQSNEDEQHFETRRQVLLGITARAALSACGGGSPAASVRDRQIGVAPGVSLHVRDWPAASGGYGASSKPLPVNDANDMTYAPATLVADLQAVLDALQVKRAIVAGHSIAGNELTLFAGDHPQRVRGLVYLDTTFDYLASGGDEDSEPTPFDEPPPGQADLASVAASITYARRINKQWWPALEANWRDALEVLPGGAVRPSTPPAVARAMDRAAHEASGCRGAEQRPDARCRRHRQRAPEHHAQHATAHARAAGPGGQAAQQGQR